MFEGAKSALDQLVTMVFTCDRVNNAVNNLIFIDSEALPVTRQFARSTRTSSSSAITSIPNQSRTVTYQRSFFICACRA